MITIKNTNLQLRQLEQIQYKLSGYGVAIIVGRWLPIAALHSKIILLQIINATKILSYIYIYLSYLVKDFAFRQNGK